MFASDFLFAALRPDALPKPPQSFETSQSDAITGETFTRGYPVSAITTNATNEFLDTFRGHSDGFVSEKTARVFKVANIGAWLIFKDGNGFECFKPMISRESAREQNRPCWSDLAREVWPSRHGQNVLCLLTTDFKKRLWPRARIGALGNATPVFFYDSANCAGGNLFLNWQALIRVLDCVEPIYEAGFSKKAIFNNLYNEQKPIAANGFHDTMRWERELSKLRDSPEPSFHVTRAA